MRITMTATYEDLWWTEECTECGEDVRYADGAELDYRGPDYHGGGWVCPEHGLRSDAQHDPSPNESREGGYTDPHNPWGGFRSVMPDTPQEAGYADWAAWSAENVSTVEFSSLWEAAQFVIDFPGGVWDYRETENSETDYRTGVETSVTLHVGDEHAMAVFAFADRIDGGEWDDDDDMIAASEALEYRIDRDASMVPLPLP